MKFNNLTGCIIMLLLPAMLSGQQYGFRNFSLEDGLPQTEIQGLIQDSRGIIWAGTNGGGLVRFNGQSFDVISTREGRNHHPPFQLTLTKIGLPKARRVITE